MRFFETVQQNMADLTNSIASLNLATLRDDIMNSVRDVVRQEAVSQVCDRCPGPSPTRAANPAMAGPRRDERTAPTGPPRVYPVASIGEQGRLGQDLTMLVPAHPEAPAGYPSDHHLRPSKSLLVQRYVAMAYTNVGPAMIGTTPAEDRISRISEKMVVVVLKVKRDNYHWTEEQVARLIMIMIMIMIMLSCCSTSVSAILAGLSSSSQLRLAS